jgi:hypothetical protein
MWVRQIAKWELEAPKGGAKKGQHASYFELARCPGVILVTWRGGVGVV